MSKVNKLTSAERERQRQVKAARADLARRAREQGIKPITSLEELAGDPEFTADFDPDELIRTVRRWRDTPSS